MNSVLEDAAAKVFQYPTRAVQRRHGPRGYLGVRLYKVWLRDEFCFRCVYCLCRERWEPNGQAAFSIEHIEPRATHPQRAAAYDNLLCSCSVCNACRRDEPLPLDPTTESLALHLRMAADGSIDSLTPQGSKLCDLCHLNRPRLVQFRLYVTELVAHLQGRPELAAARALQRILGFPDDLPNLQSLRPPGGNFRPEGIATSWFAMRTRAKLPLGY
jgi:hypothetical protein